MSRPSCLLYDLYLPTLGGGERVLFAMAAALEPDYTVTLAGPRLPDPGRAATLGFPDLPLRRLPMAAYALASRRADVAVYLANRLPLPSLARRSFVIAQFPFTSLSRRAPVRAVQERVLDAYEVLTYSEFAARWVERRWRRPASVLHPPVSLGPGRSAAEERLILSVGRFFGVHHSKRQDVLVEAFARLPVDVRRSWRLVLAGGVQDDAASRAFVRAVRERAHGLPIDVETDVSAARLRALYERATLYWHATGFGRADGQPERAEHFGITTVEAMSHGVVPLVYDDGGSAEVVDDSNGVRWRTVDELVAATTALAADDARRTSLAESAVRASRRYGEEAFATAVRALVASEPPLRSASRTTP